MSFYRDLGDAHIIGDLGVGVAYPVSGWLGKPKDGRAVCPFVARTFETVRGLLQTEGLTTCTKVTTVIFGPPVKMVRKEDSN
jgi:hypothetical protein